MEILKAKKIITGGENPKILRNSCVVIESDKILEITSEKEAQKKFKDAKICDFGESVIAPAFVNTHVHLEFSSNVSTLKYGDFIKWLGSIVDKGGELAKMDAKKAMSEAINSLLKSGVCAIGEISSFGSELEILAASPLKVVLFSEILGSNEQMTNQNLQNFLAKFEKTKSYKSQNFTPAISLHSPYSVHPKLAKAALEIAKKDDLLVSTHFLESRAEKQWLEHGSGGFKKHLLRFNPDPKPMYDADGYFAMFREIDTLFTHCVYVSDFAKFKPHHSVTHCAVSNRLLGKKALNLKEIFKNDVSLNIGTDGLSSNISLNFWHELRAALFTHASLDLNELASRLFVAATHGGAKALRTNNGEIKAGRAADIAVYNDLECDDSELILQLILHTNEAKKLYIGGKICKF